MSYFSYFQAPPSPCSSECIDWRFNYSGLDVSSSLQQSFSLVCNKEDVRKFHGTIIFLGLALGSLPSGFLSDRIGRVKLFRISAFIITLSVVLIGSINSLTLHLFLWFLISVQISATWISSLTYTSEIAPTKYRDIPLMVDSIFLGIGIILCSLMAYWISDWKNLSLVLGLITFVGGILTLFLPESPRWLWSVNRYQEAIEILEFAMTFQRASIQADLTSKLEELKRNGRPKLGFLQSFLRDFASIVGTRQSMEEVSSSKEQHSLNDLARHPFLAKRTILLFYHWTVANFLFFGSLHGAQLFNQQLHVYLAIQGAAGSLGCICGIVVLRYLGRKDVMVLSFSVSGCCFLMPIFTPSTSGMITLTFVFANKFALQVAFVMCYIWTAELNPTTLRSLVIGLASTTSRFSGLAIPFLDNFSQIWQPLPFLLNSLLAFSVTFCSVLLPETKGRKFPETLEDAKRLGRKDHSEIGETQPILKAKSKFGRIM